MALKFSIFEKYPELKYGFSEKSDGSMRFFAEERKEKPIKENRDKYFLSQRVDPGRVVMGWLVHDKKVAVVDSDQAGQVISATDGLITNIPELFLSVTNADCFPIYYYDPAKKAVGLAHAGWKGVAINIAGEVIKSMKEKFGCRPEDILTGIGPGIQRCHFDIKEENSRYYKEYPESVIRKNSQALVDLAGIIKKQLLIAGVKQENTEDCGLCTYCLKDRYFSFRRDKPLNVEAMAAYIGLGFHIQPPKFDRK